VGCGTPAGWGDGMALQIKEVHPQGIAVVKWPVNWLQETPSVLKVVGDHWPGLPASDYGPPYDLGSLRRQLQGEAPGFTDLANRVMATLLSKFSSIIPSGAKAGTSAFFRWRLDTMREGLEAHPGFCNEETMAALNDLADLINHPQSEFRGVLPADSLCIVNNHYMLHGRTGFQDPGRHLVRIRFHACERGL